MLILLLLSAYTREPVSWGACWPILGVIVLALAVVLVLLNSGPERPT